MGKRKNATFGLEVRKMMIESPKLRSGYRVVYGITEEDLPLYEVNRWLELYSDNSHLTGSTYAYHLLDYLRYLKMKNIHYRAVTNKTIIRNYIKYLVYGEKNHTFDIQGNISFPALKNRISVVKQFYHWLEEEGEVEVNPVGYSSKVNKKGKKFIKSKFLYGQIWIFDLESDSLVSKLRFKESQDHIKWYEDDEMKRIFNSLPTLRDKIIFAISIETGMRIGEILGLKLYDVDTSKGEIQIKKDENIENDARAKNNRENGLYK